MSIWTEKTLNAAIRLVSKDPNKLLQIPEVRSLVSSDRLERAQEKIKIADSEHNSRSNTIKHNLNNLGGLSGFDRGSTLILPLLLLEEFQLLGSFTKCLCIGPRNEAELLALLGFGIKENNLRGLDLISYSEFVDLGDMHCMPYEDNSFDVIIAGWVLAYSANVDQAIHEICRVLRPGGIVSVGWDMARKTVEKTNQQIRYHEQGILDKSESMNLECAADISKLFSGLGYQVISVFSQNSKAPYDSVTRRNIFAARIYPQYSCPAIVDTVFRDELALRVLSQHIANSNLPNPQELQEILGSIGRDLYRQDHGKEMNAHQFLRKNTLSKEHGVPNLSGMISQAISSVCPHSYSTRYIGIGDIGFTDRTISIPDEESARIARSIKENGYAETSYHLEPWVVKAICNISGHLHGTTSSSIKYRISEFSGPGELTIDGNSTLLIPEIVEIGLSHSFITIAEQHLNTLPVFESATLSFSLQGKAGISKLNKGTQSFHRDKSRPSSLRIYIYLTDVDFCSGALTMIPGSHTLSSNSPQDAKEYRHSEESSVTPSMAKSFVGSAGKIIFVDPHALHTFLPVQNDKKRIMLELQYSNSLIGSGYTRIPSSCLLSMYPNLHQLLKDFPKVFQAFDVTPDLQYRNATN
jgi:SAM-dependent methyltransferase